MPRVRPLRRLCHSRRRGVTILEVLVATVILGIGLIGVGSMVTCAVISHDRAVGFTIASDRATAELERIREAGYNNALVDTALFPTSDYTIASATQVSFTVADLADGHGTITLGEDSQALQNNPATGTPYMNLKQAKVQIWWRQTGRHTTTLVATTLITNRP